jgi:hypothetical protein
LRSIFTSAKQNGTSQADVQSQINAVLTPTQRQALASDIKAGAHAGHHHHNSSDSAAATSSVSDTSAQAIANIQNQATAAGSTIANNLQQQVLGSNGNLVTE